ncbi:hypothetical protein M406DRAFT_262986 [Cryphonectria parasitica EP155]|uniref:Peptidase C14 caspase domain-containing protein n=1 Tax=Cryphonectria parasitica (strain ATCC 38755 / EP155) TaxID=660469 RepID=A0A9P5CME7_CRYP1|nr:uncharacterized protein M406DRAFT_262986 [Cryphonectria parasitica EP155]KAF3764028.1 hypothetical protein M406DRAFT_262986 [Cryphonectria parasitica EP155]
MPIKRGLVICSPYGRLKGPPNDIEKMGKLLDGLDFEVTRCEKEDATRKGILRALQVLIDSASSEDTIVIYYSGHGGMVESVKDKHGKSIAEVAVSRPWRYQFIVPMDFDEAPGGEFGGILGLELSLLLWRLTEKTHNVTIILDCCYAGRMARDPALGDTAVSRAIPLYRFDDILKHEQLRQRQDLQQDTHTDDNPFLVRIAAAAPNETAWEYQNSHGDWCGAMTEALERVLSESNGIMTTWGAIMLRVAEAVNIQFPRQHPRVEGPGDRLHFSLQTRPYGDGEFRLQKDTKTGEVAIQAGYVSRVYEHDIYTIVHLEDSGRHKTPVAEASVTQVSAFQAIVELLPLEGCEVYEFPDDGALAVLSQSGLPRWPVRIPPDLAWLDSALKKSRFVRPAEIGYQGPVLAEFGWDSQVLALYAKGGVKLVSILPHSNQSTSERDSRCLEAVGHLARAQHLLSLQDPVAHETLEHSIEIEFGTVNERGEPERIIGDDGDGYVTEGDRVYISLANTGVECLYVWVFDVNVAGRIGILSGSSPDGLELPPGRFECIGTNREGRVRGKKVWWPKDLPRTQAVQENLLFILTSSPVDLSHLRSPKPAKEVKRGRSSSLETLIYQIWSGGSRIATASDDDAIRYAMFPLQFLLRPTHQDET